jgi:hypothetical protein
LASLLAASQLKPQTLQTPWRLKLLLVQKTLLTHR